jgi:hypothetical protein
MTRRKPVAFTVREITAFQRPLTMRMPFRFGAATVTACPQAFVRVRLEVDGREVEGASAELMVPKWFDKSPALTHEDNFNQLRRAVAAARETCLATPVAASAYALSASAGAQAITRCVADGLPRLAAQFGPALIDKAIADAVLRASGLDWVSGVQAGVLGDPWSASIRLMRPDSVWLRHTVGLADRLEADDAGTPLDDGLPDTLEDAIAHYGLRYFKLKLSGQPEADVERLTRIERLLARAPNYRVTLDGNETYAGVAAIEALFDALARQPATARLVQRTLLLEQPLPRHLALQQSLAGARIPVPVILDESDDDEAVLAQGLAQGYRGISSKACKGIYRSLAHAARLRGRPDHLLSGEDLTCQAGLAVQQDSLLAASLGVTHIERNGHHYVGGFGAASAEEMQGFLRAHAGLYRATPQGVRLRVQDGRLDLRSLHAPGFAHAASPRWDTLEPLTP